MKKTQRKVDAQAQEAEALLRSLLDWASYMGGWESSEWRRAENWQRKYPAAK